MMTITAITVKIPPRISSMLVSSGFVSTTVVGVCSGESMLDMSCRFDWSLCLGVCCVDGSDVIWERVGFYAVLGVRENVLFFFMFWTFLEFSGVFWGFLGCCAWCFFCESQWLVPWRCGYLCSLLGVLSPHQFVVPFRGWLLGTAAVTIKVAFPCRDWR